MYSFLQQFKILYVCVYVCARTHMNLISLENTTGNCWPQASHLNWVSESLNLYGHFPLYTASTAIICQKRCTRLFGSLSKDVVFHSSDN